MVVARSVLSVLSEKDRKFFFAQEDDDIKTQVLVDYLNYCLCHANLADSHLVSLRLESRLSRVCDAFCAAYGDDDLILMEFCTSFVRDAFELKRSKRKLRSSLSERNMDSEEKDEEKHAKACKVESSTLLSLMQQVLLATDCCGGNLISSLSFLLKNTNQSAPT